MVGNFKSGVAMESDVITIETNSGAETQRLGAAAGRLLTGDAIITLAGDLGAGKTTFVQGLGQGLGVRATITSPTFVLINRYRTADGRQLQHADCYRLANAPLEMWDAGLSDMFLGDDVVVVEWADRIPELLPPEYLDVSIEHGDGDLRRFTFVAHGSRYVELLHRLSAVIQEQA
jgi:tRNA threonylcarbamoyladenosine biosynthesis protein TsaE